MKSTEIIQPLAIAQPVANDGTRNTIPEDATGSNLASIEEGFPDITMQSLADGGLPPMGEDFNGLFYLSTDQRIYLQNGGIITFSDDVSNAIGGYPAGAVLDYINSDGDYCKVKSLIDDNTYNFIDDSSYINDAYWSYIAFYNTEITSAGYVMYEDLTDEDVFDITVSGLTYKEI